MPDPQNLHLWLEIDGHRYQDGSTRTMVFGVAHLVSYLSRFMTLHPGDILSTGMPPGLGLGQKPPFIFAPATSFAAVSTDSAISANSLHRLGRVTNRPDVPTSMAIVPGGHKRSTIELTQQSPEREQVYPEL